MRGYVRQRFIRDDGSPTPLGAALLDEYERNVPTSELYERYFITDCARMLEQLIGLLGGTWRKEERMLVSTARLMRLYVEHQDCAKVGQLTGLTSSGVYLRLYRAGWSNIKRGFRGRTAEEKAARRQAAADRRRLRGAGYG